MEMTKDEKELMKNFKVEELEERLEMRLWDGKPSDHNIENCAEQECVHE